MYNKISKNIDAIFEALYGNRLDGLNKPLAEFYSVEIREIEADYYRYINTMRSLCINVTSEDIVKLIIFLERVHIGNEHIIKESLNTKKLKRLIQRFGLTH